MRVEVTGQFNKDISKLRDKKLLLALKSALLQIESAKTLTEVSNLKKWKAQPIILECALAIIAWVFILIKILFLFPVSSIERRFTGTSLNSFS